MKPSRTLPLALLTGLLLAACGSSADRQAPNVDLQATLNGTAVNLTATVSDNVGVTLVEFYRGTEKIGEDRETPYTATDTVTSAQNGTLTYRAVALDAAGNRGEDTATVNVAIDAAPTVSVSASSTALTRDASVTVRANAQDDRGITKVEFYLDGQLVFTDTEPPYETTLPFTFRQNGVRTIRVVAYDTAGQTAEATQLVTVALDPGEDNDVLERATLINIGEGVNARIAGVARDRDYYRFNAQEGERLRLTVRTRSGPFPQSTLDPYVEILMPDGRTVLERDDDSGEEYDADIRFNAPQAGTYYVMVTSFDIYDDETATDDDINNQYRIELERR
ncbi:Ig-like domain-containing protein [Deinococcus sp. MIMF12]|uniref:Ig-like domain-containing protein n=1 Tax=Deinococcus rhizophilus TaxID=3049544 RepID=A0ABT7JE18_9DEIO|nr:Ig-like domain-containing protein [Deinococcus rhizophilus]MDL2342725.1 Ig-like domain-containing protein [Deinococcus rhizophilus]